METLQKYPSTLHIPDSLGIQRDDTCMQDYSCFEGKQVVITEKMDGENTTMYRDYIHARSLDSRHHPSRSWVKNFHSGLCQNIPEGMRICGENVFAKHSIEYENLQTYFYVFGIYQDDVCLSWEDTVLFSEVLGMHTVPVLYQGIFTEDLIRQTVKSIDVTKQEGFVIRSADSFNFSNFQQNVGKYVRANHVQTNKHWKDQPVIPNKMVV